MKKKLLCIIYGTLLAITACEKAIDKKDAEMPTIKLSSPENHAEYATSDTVFIKGVISDNEMLQEVVLILERETPELKLLHFRAEPGSSSYILDTFYIVRNDTSEYHINVEATDQLGNKSELKYHAHINMTE